MTEVAVRVTVLGGADPLRDGAPIVSYNDTEWMALGSCTSYPEDLWFEEGQKAVRRAKAICRGCPVLLTCENHAMALTQVLADNRKLSYDEGVIAGMTPRERLIRLRSSDRARADVRSTGRRSS